MQSPLLFPTKGDTLITILHIFIPYHVKKSLTEKSHKILTSKKSGLMLERERERANSIMSKGWKMLLMNFCELDKYLPVQTVIIFVPIFYTKGLLINMFNIFAGIVRFMWSFGECIWYCKCSIQCNHCGRYTVTRLPTIIHISIFHHHCFRRHGYLNLVLFMFWDWRNFFWRVTFIGWPYCIASIWRK